MPTNLLSGSVPGHNFHGFERTHQISPSDSLDMNYSMTIVELPENTAHYFSQCELYLLSSSPSSVSWNELGLPVIVWTENNKVHMFSSDMQIDYPII